LQQQKQAICSAFNVAHCFALLAAGASGTSRAQLEGVFGFAPAAADPTRKASVLAADAAAALTAYSAAGAAGIVRTFAGVYAPAKAPMRPEYKAAAAALYHAVIKDGFTSAADALAAINADVNAATSGMIPTLLSSLDDLYLAVLVSAIYFHGKWLESFDAGLTKQEPFRLPGGATAPAPMMNRAAGTARTFTSADGKTFYGAIPYKEGYYLVVEMPADRQDVSLVETSNVDNVLTAVGASESTKVRVKLPKFRTETSVDLIPMLKQLGLTAPFDRNTDFGEHMFDEGVPVVVSQAIHKAVVEVDEEGTKAAAASVIEMETCCSEDSPPPPPPEIICDRPFRYHIVDGNRRLVLFSGAYTAPS
jgi:serpin B